MENLIKIHDLGGTLIFGNTLLVEVISSPSLFKPFLSQWFSVSPGRWNWLPRRYFHRHRISFRLMAVNGISSTPGCKTAIHSKISPRIIWEWSFLQQHLLKIPFSVKLLTTFLEATNSNNPISTPKSIRWPAESGKVGCCEFCNESGHDCTSMSTTMGTGGACLFVRMCWKPP